MHKLSQRILAIFLSLGLVITSSPAFSLTPSMFSPMASLEQGLFQEEALTARSWLGGRGVIPALVPHGLRSFFEGTHLPITGPTKGNVGRRKIGFRWPLQWDPTPVQGWQTEDGVGFGNPFTVFSKLPKWQRPVFLMEMQGIGGGGSFSPEFRQFLRQKKIDDDELAALIQENLAMYSEVELRTFIETVERFRLNKNPVHVYEKTIDDTPTIVTWFSLRKDLKLLPRFHDASLATGLTHEQAFELLMHLMTSIRSNHIEEYKQIERLQYVLEMASQKNIRMAQHFTTLRDFISLTNKNGVLEQALWAFAFTLQIGLDVEQSCRLIRKLPDAHFAMSGYIFGRLLAALNCILVAKVDPDLVVRVFNIITDEHSPYSENQYEAFTLSMYVGVAIYGLSPNEILREMLTTLETTKTLPAVQEPSKIEAETPENGTEQVALMRPQKKDMYFEQIEGPIVRALLPYKVKKSWREGVIDLVRLAVADFGAGEGNFEVATVFDPRTETWYSLGGMTNVKIGRVRHEFVSYDVSKLSPEPVYFHVHPAELELLIAPDRDSVPDGDLREKMTKFASSMPSRADFATLSALIKESSQPVPLRAAIAHSLGVTEIVFPNDPQQLEALAQSIQAMKDQVLMGVNVRTYARRYGQSEDKAVFVQRLTEEVNRLLPKGFEIRLHLFPQQQNEAHFAGAWWGKGTWAKRGWKTFWLSGLTTPVNELLGHYLSAFIGGQSPTFSWVDSFWHGKIQISGLARYMGAVANLTVGLAIVLFLGNHFGLSNPLEHPGFWYMSYVAITQIIGSFVEVLDHRGDFAPIHAKILEAA